MIATGRNRWADQGWPPRLIAHRGLHGLSTGQVENSLSAFHAAADRGYAIEMDIQPARCGTPMVFHDDSLSRLTDRTGLVADHTASDLAAIPLRGTSDTIPTLETVLAAIQPEIWLLIEIKWPRRSPDALVERMVRATAALAASRERTALMAFAPRVLAMLRPHWRGPLGFVSARFSDAESRAALWPHQRVLRANLWPAFHDHADFIAYRGADLPRRSVRYARAHGKAIFAWTVRDPAEATRLRPSVDGLIFEQFLPQTES